MFAKQEQETPFNRAFKGSVSLISECTESPILLKSVDGDGRTLLHWACSGNNPELAQTLIEKGSEVNSQDESGMTPLTISCAIGSDKLVDVLLNSNSNPNITTVNKVSPMHYCASKNWLDIARRLVFHGADHSIRDNLGQTPIFRAAARGNLSFIQFLVYKESINLLG